MRISDWSSDVCSSDLSADTPVRIELIAARGIEIAAKILFAVRWGGANMIVAAAADGAIAGDTKRAEAVDLAIFGLEHRHRIAEQVRRDRSRAIGRELEIIGDGDLDTVGPDVTEDRKSTRLNSSH